MHGDIRQEARSQVLLNPVRHRGMNIVSIPGLQGPQGTRVSKVTEANLSLSTSGGPVEVGSIRAHDAIIRTRGGDVKVNRERSSVIHPLGLVSAPRRPGR